MSSETIMALMKKLSKVLNLSGGRTNQSHTSETTTMSLKSTALDVHLDVGGDSGGSSIRTITRPQRQPTIVVTDHDTNNPISVPLSIPSPRLAPRTMQEDIISPMMLDSSSVSTQNNKTSTITTTAPRTRPKSVSTSTVPTNITSLRLRLSPAVIQRQPPWPIKSLPTLTSMPVSRPSTATTIRPPAGRLSTMPTLFMTGGERPHLKAETDMGSNEREYMEMEGTELEGEDGEGEDEDYFMLPRDPGERASRPSMDSIDEDGSSRAPSPSASNIKAFGTSVSDSDSSSLSSRRYPPGPSLSPPNSAPAEQIIFTQNPSPSYFTFTRDHENDVQTPKARSALRTPRPGDYRRSDIFRCSEDNARPPEDGKATRPDDTDLRSEGKSRRSEDGGSKAAFWSRNGVLRPEEYSVPEGDNGSLWGGKDKGKGKGKAKSRRPEFDVVSRLETTTTSRTNTFLPKSQAQSASLPQSQSTNNNPIKSDASNSSSGSHCSNPGSPSSSSARSGLTSSPTSSYPSPSLTGFGSSSTSSRTSLSSLGSGAKPFGHVPFVSRHDYENAVVVYEARREGQGGDADNEVRDADHFNIYMGRNNSHKGEQNRIRPEAEHFRGVDNEERPKLYHHPSRSMIDLSSPKQCQVRPTPQVHPPKQNIPKRRRSLPTLSPPSYSSITASSGIASSYASSYHSHASSKVSYPRDEPDSLPCYTNTIVLVAQMPRKLEFTSPGVISRDRKWRRVWCVLEGTKMGVYRVKDGMRAVWEGVVGAGDGTVYRREPNVKDRAREEELGRLRKFEQEHEMRGRAMEGVELMLRNASPVELPSQQQLKSLSRTSSSEDFRPNSSLLIREYSLQHAESGLGTDYIKRKNVIRVRMDGEQFLLQAKDIEEVVAWIEGLQAAANVALDLDERPMPRGPLFPRRRRRRRRAQAVEGQTPLT